jgi:hypothetical protein
MLDVVNLALPFFSLIFLGYACCHRHCSIDGRDSVGWVERRRPPGRATMDDDLSRDADLDPCDRARRGGDRWATMWRNG